MGACNSKAPADPAAQQAQKQTCENAPVLLADPTGENTQIKSTAVDQIKSTPADELQQAGSPTSLTPCSPTEGPRSALPSLAPSPEKEVQPAEPSEEKVAEVVEVLATPKEKFDTALAWVKSPANTMKGVPNDRKLNLYKFYKQATDGNVKGTQPWATQLEARAKWDAWNSVKGMAAEDAMNRYVEELESQKKQFGGR